MTPAPSRATIHLRLGRVSNLPTVWTNVLAGAVLGGGSMSLRALVPTGVAMSAFYVGGMYLNDAFDAEIDAKERPERPIPAGHIPARDVFTMGFGLLGVGMLLLALSAITGVARPAAIGTGALLAFAIVLYDAWHKKNPLSPLLMGACRVLVYLTAALATGGELRANVWAGAAVLLGYLIGLTYIAKQENRKELRGKWPLVFLAVPILYAPSRGLVSLAVTVLMAAVSFWITRALGILRSRAPSSIPKAVAALIAGISLVDALLAAAHGRVAVAALAALTLPVTLALHRRVAGT